MLFEPLADRSQTNWYVGTYLKRLGLDAEKPTLDYLNRIVSRHQTRIPFETFTRINDFFDYPERRICGIGEYVSRMASQGAGGVCWSLACGCHWLLEKLGFTAALLLMEPGHLVISVRLDQEYYVDVGFSAPLFKAFPLRESFTVSAPSEKFIYRAGENEVEVTREVAPELSFSKAIRSFAALTPELLRRHFRAANEPGASKFLQLLTISRYNGGRLVRLKSDTLTEFSYDGERKTILNGEQILNVLRDVFAVDPRLYLRAKAHITVTETSPA